MNTKNEIRSISDLVAILHNLQAPEQGKTRFFRGQADETWDLLPSIYRKDKPNLINHEDKIIKDAFTNCPDDFLPSDTLFEKLVKLQHYGYRTRLLDLTANALVGLYFACWDEKHHDKDGELIILDIPDEEIKYDDSDTVAILSALSLQNYQFSITNYLEFASKTSDLEIKRYWVDRENKNHQLKNNNNINLITEAILKEAGLPDWEKLQQLGAKEFGERVFLEIFNQQKGIISLLHEIHSDKPSFRPVINPKDLSRVLCVRAKMNNARISRQQGCFLIYGIDENKCTPAKMPDNWQQKSSQNEKFIIKAENKAQIIQELKSFGISTRILFPELEKQAEEIMSQY